MSYTSFPTPQAVQSRTFTVPPLDGTLSLPEIYDWHRLHSPNHSLFVYQDGFSEVRTITWSHAVRAIHVAARLVEAALKSTSNGSSRLSTVVGVLAMTGL